jgi:SMC interacting uncharacterized protein involved in chromosome segregation
MQSFTPPISGNLDEMKGYSDAISQLLNYIANETKWKPENRFIDSVPLLNEISAITDELTRNYKQLQRELTRYKEGISAVDIAEQKYPDLLDAHSSLLNPLS